MAIDIENTCIKDTCISSIYNMDILIRYFKIDDIYIRGICDKDIFIRSVEPKTLVRLKVI